MRLMAVEVKTVRADPPHGWHGGIVSIEEKSCALTKAAELPDSLPHILAPAFQRLFHVRHELVCYGTIDQAMVVT